MLLKKYLKKSIDLKVEKFINKPIRITDLIEILLNLTNTINTKRSLLERKQELEHYRQAIESTCLVTRIRSDGKLIGVNKELNKFLNVHKDDSSHAISKESFFNTKLFDELLYQTKSLKIINKTTTFIYQNKLYTVQLTAFASLLKNDEVQEISIIFNNISPIIKDQDETINLLYTDELTGLPNRQKMFYDLQRYESKTGLILIDIERFSNINYLYGYEVGDRVLKQMAVILKKYLHQEQLGTLYRTDMDHFVILTGKVENFNRDEMKHRVRMIINYIEKHDFSIDKDTSINIGVKVGASCLVNSDHFIEGSLALATAKEEHKPFMCYLDLKGVKKHFETNIRMQHKVKTALKMNLIHNYYQAIVDADKKIIKYEALVRMEDLDEKGRMLTPDHFLNIARQSKNYPLLTKQVISNTFRDFGNGSFNVSINLSFDDIINPDIIEYLEQSMIKHPDAKITLELLESEGLKDIQKTIDFCIHMKNYGALIAIDDFGVGYSNFVYFFDIPIDILKIDGSLVKRIHEPKGQVLLEIIVSLSQHLGIKTVAEFVENETIFKKLRSLGVDMYQGYYFAQPKPFEMIK